MARKGEGIFLIAWAFSSVLMGDIGVCIGDIYAQKKSCIISVMCFTKTWRIKKYPKLLMAVVPFSMLPHGIMSVDISCLPGCLVASYCLSVDLLRLF